jgi:hypothetical protein
MENLTLANPKPSLYIDNTRRSSYATCQRKFFYRFVKNLTSINGSTALRYGSTWHGLMEGYYSSIIKNGWSAENIEPAIKLATQVWTRESENKLFYDDYRTLENAFQCFIAYLEQFKDDSFMMDILQSERIFCIEMTLTDKEKSLYKYLNEFTLYFTGKLDLEVSLGGQHWIVEFKTTGQPIQLQASRLQRSAQILGYTWAAQKLGADITGTLISLHQLLARKVKDGGYGKTTREFFRQPNVFNKADLLAWRESFLFTANQIAYSQITETYPCQYDSCYQFGQCSGTKLCEQNRPFSELNTEGFMLEEWDVLKTGPSNLETVQVIKIKE